MTLTPVNPIEALVLYVRAKMPGVKVDTKHRFGEGWDALTDSAIILVPSGGVADRYAPLVDLLVDVWAYGPTQYAASILWRDFVAVARATDREPITIGGDQDGVTALVYHITQESAPSFAYDDAVRMDVCYCVVSARLGEVAA